MTAQVTVTQSKAITNSVKNYVSTQIAAAIASSVDYKGGYDAGTNTPDLDVSPSGVDKGDMYTVTVAGTFFTTDVEAGDVLIAEVDDAAAEADWTVVQKNFDLSLYLQNLVEDTTPQLGGDLDVNGQKIISGGNITCRLGDALGVQKLLITSSTDATVFSIDSTGNQITTSIKINGGVIEPYTGSQDLTLKMSDAVGARKISFVDSADAEKAQIDSLGNFAVAGRIGVGESVEEWTTNQNNIDVHASHILVETGNNDVVLSGFVPKYDGEIKFITNHVTFEPYSGSLTLSHSDANSSVANRMFLRDSKDLVFDGLGTVGIIYDGDQDRWIPFTVPFSEIRTYIATQTLRDSAVNSEASAFTADYDSRHNISGSWTGDASLPTASGHAGEQIEIYCEESYTGLCTVNPNGSETIGGNASLPMIAGESILAESDGTNWRIVRTNINVYFEGKNTAGTILTANLTPIPWTEVKDTHSIHATDTVTAPFKGLYKFKITGYVSSGSGGWNIWVNGLSNGLISSEITTSAVGAGSKELLLNEGDTVQIRSRAAHTLSGGVGLNQITVSGIPHHQ